MDNFDHHPTRQVPEANRRKRRRHAVALPVLSLPLPLPARLALRCLLQVLKPRATPERFGPQRLYPCRNTEYGRAATFAATDFWRPPEELWPLMVSNIHATLPRRKFFRKR